MAEVIAKFNTKTKELSVTMDGKDVSNVMSINMSKAGGYYSDSDSDDKNEFGCSILTLDKYKDDGYSSYTQIVAAESLLGKQAVKAGAVPYKDNADFVAQKQLSVAQNAVRKLLGGK